jgi:4-amino-4-deoxy-L-arabinose transferase-like glycosyltransferase
VPNGSPRPDPGELEWPRLGRRVVVVLLVLAAALASALSLVPYDQLKEHVDAFTVDRDADVTREEFDGIVGRLRVLAIGFGVLAVGLLTFGRTIDRTTDGVARAWWSALRTAPSRLRAWVVSETRSYLVAAGAILVAAVAVRIAYLDVPLRYDEATTYNNFVSKPLYVALANYATPNNHLLHTFLAKVSVGVFGNEVWAIRLPALVAGIALVPATLALARVLYGRAAGLLAAAFVAASSTFVEYSTNARGYTLVALATVLVFIAAARALEWGSDGAWAVVAVVGALGLYAVPVMIYPLGGALLWILVSGIASARPLRPLLTRLGATALVTAVLTLFLYAPVYAASGVRSVTANEFVEPRTWGTLLDLFPEHVSDTVATWTRDVPFVASLALGIGLLVGILATPWISRFRVPVVLTVAVWSLLVLAIQRVVPYTRVWLFLVPLAAATTAGLYGWLLERRPWGARAGSVIAAALALAGSLLVLSADSVRESRETGALLDAPAIAAFLAARVEPDDRILATGSDTILEYYLGRAGVDARPLLYTDEPHTRTYVVVNTLGGQTIDDLLPQLADQAGLSRAELLTSFDSGRVYLVRRPD